MIVADITLSQEMKNGENHARSDGSCGRRP